MSNPPEPPRSYEMPECRPRHALVHYATIVNGVERTLSLSPRHIVGFSSRRTVDQWQRTVVLIYVSGQGAPLEIQERSVGDAIEKWRTAMALDVADETALVVAVLRQVLNEVRGLRTTKHTKAPDEAV